MNDHRITVLAVPNGSVWSCSCGKFGIPVRNLSAAGTVFVTGEERARAAGKLHVEANEQPWPFPPSTYDYAYYGVGNRSRPIEIDKDEIARIIEFYATRDK